MDDAVLREELLRFETALASRDPAGVSGGLMRLVAHDFMEFGRSGRTWTRDEIRELLQGPPASVSIQGFQMQRLGADVALVTYRAADANRSSVWVRRSGTWQIRFHQGTPVDQAHPTDSPPVEGPVDDS